METGYLPDELGAELLRLNEELDPEDLVVQYQQTLGKFDQIASHTLSDRYLTEAKELLKKGDLAQASEKVWGCVCTCGEEDRSKKGFKAGRAW